MSIATGPREPLLIRGEHASSLHAVGAQLSQLHHELLRMGADDVRPVRTAVITLVCICTDEVAADASGDVVRRIVDNHPARVIFVVADRNATPDGVDADLALECSAIGAAGGADQVCAESVRLVVRGAPALHLSSVVTPLLLPDVPVVLWLTGAPPLAQALHGEAIKVCQRIVLDSDAYDEPLDALRDLADAHFAHGRIPIGDLAWARLLPWRELLAQSFDGRDMLPFLHGVRGIEVVSSGARPSSEAWLLAGWLASRLSFAQDAPPRIDVTADSPVVVESGGLLSVHLSCELDGRTAEVTVQRNPGTTVTHITTSDGLSAGATMATQRPDLYALVGRELQESEEDPVYAAAVQSAARLASA